MPNRFLVERLWSISNEIGWNTRDFSRESLRIAIQMLSTVINEEGFQFSLKKKKNFVAIDYPKGSLEYFVHEVIFLTLADELKKVYKDKQGNRQIIIKQLKVLLEEDCPKFIIKADIKSFYESVDFLKLIDKIDSDRMISFQGRYLLRKLHENLKEIGCTGLPRGISVSAILAEIYLRRLDKWIKQFHGVYYYARYVDDIVIIFSSKLDESRMWNELPNKLSKLCSLKLNIKKSRMLSEKFDFEYLGYRFHNYEKILTIGLAQKKIKKIKTRIVRSFLDFIKNENFCLLLDRLKFLTGNFLVSRREDCSELRAGIYYSNQYLTLPYNDLKELNIFYYNLLHSTYAFKKKLQNSLLKLSTVQKEKLNKISFIFGFKKKVYHHFSSTRIKVIEECWCE